MSEPGTAAAAEEVNQFKAMLASKGSARIRLEFRFLLNGISAQVTDQDELLDLMTFDFLQDVTPLVTFLLTNANAAFVFDAFGYLDVTTI